jgi:hypothetical protein
MCILCVYSQDLVLDQYQNCLRLVDEIDQTNTIKVILIINASNKNTAYVSQLQFQSALGVAETSGVHRGIMTGWACGTHHNGNYQCPRLYGENAPIDPSPNIAAVIVRIWEPVPRQAQKRLS